MHEPTTSSERAVWLVTLQAAVGHAFEDLALLDQALTHRSYLNETDDPAARDNERLEFLGDAVLGFVAGEHLYRALPDEPEGVLTALRAALVRETTLARFARQLALGEGLRLGRGEESTGGRDRAAVLGDAFEALIGAVYVDGGLAPAARLIEAHVVPELARVIAERRHHDARTEFQERIQAVLRQTPSYRTVDIEGPHHDRRFTVEVLVGERPYGRGSGRSKAEAARLAALAALERIEREGLDEPEDPA